MRDQPGFFDVDDRLKRLSDLGDQLEGFRAAVDFVVANNQLVEPLYQLEKAGKLSDQGGAGAEGRSFLEGQLVKSGQLLGDLWLTAWLTAPEDTYLERELRQRTPAQAK